MALLLHSPLILWSHMKHLGGGLLCRVLLHGSIVTWSSLEVLLEEASPAFVLGACSHGLSLMGTNLLLASSETMTEQTVGWPGPTMGRRSFTWCGFLSTVMFCTLVISVTHPTLYFVVHRPCGAFTHTWSPGLKTACCWLCVGASVSLISFSHNPFGTRPFCCIWHICLVSFAPRGNCGRIFGWPEWWQAGSNVSVLDLQKAYLQVHVHQSLWSYQTVLFKGWRYCLTCMGFSLNVAPSIMLTIVDAILMKDKHIQWATSAYINDVYVDESIVPAAHVKEHLCSFSFLSKEPERLQDGAWVLGLQVWGEDNSLYWRRGNKILDMPCVVMRWDVFSLCGKLVGHLPMGGWLHKAVSFIKRRASDVTTGWDDKIDNASLNTTHFAHQLHLFQPFWHCVVGWDAMKFGNQPNVKCFAYHLRLVTRRLK